MKAPLLFLFLILTSQFSFADTLLQDPMTCGSNYPSTLTIWHHGRKSVAALESYFFKLQFDAPGTFNYSANWDLDVKSQRVDGPHLTNAWKTGLLQKFIRQNGYLQCATKDMRACVRSLNDVLYRINIASSYIIDSPDKDAQRVALGCARSIVLSTLAKTFEINGSGLETIGGKVELPDLKTSEALSVMTMTSKISDGDTAAETAASEANAASAASVTQSLNTMFNN